MIVINYTIMKEENTNKKCKKDKYTLRRLNESKSFGGSIKMEFCYFFLRQTQDSSCPVNEFIELFLSVALLLCIFYFFVCDPIRTLIIRWFFYLFFMRHKRKILKVVPGNRFNSFQRRSPFLPHATCQRQAIKV